MPWARLQRTVPRADRAARGADSLNAADDAAKRRAGLPLGIALRQVVSRLCLPVQGTRLAYRRRDRATLKQRPAEGHTDGIQRLIAAQHLILRKLGTRAGHRKGGQSPPPLRGPV